MTDALYTVGIDLGTSNCAVAWARIAEGARAGIHDFPIAQLTRPREASQRSLLPSAIYLPGEQEAPALAAPLPWGGTSSEIVGELARWQGARVPGRLITSAKSWLCHPGVDRTAPLLPWGAPPDVRKISPVAASSLLLQHMRDAWNAAHPEASFQAQDLVITVPASFDEAARALTVNAVRAAGLEKFTLIEEPQAAFYHFTSRHRNDLAGALQNIRLVLVIDVGGGTSDFTLVETAASPEGPLLRRIAVGEHLILGGDNMDAAIARDLEGKMVRAGRKLTSGQWAQLLQQARQAKEALLGDGKLESFRVSIVSEGSQLLGGTLSGQIGRADLEQLVLDGFLPVVSPFDGPNKSGRGGIQELGLPFAQDPAITRQLAGFLRAHAAGAWQALGLPASNAQLPRPDAVLLNGGVFNSPAIRDRLMQVLGSWWPDSPPIPLLEHDSLDLAVARGAASYALVRRGFGRRIGGGAAHAFYVGLGRPGEAGATSALCLIPRGQEEDQWVELTAQPFQLSLGRPVQFPLYTSASDRIDRPGQTVELTEELHPLPPIHTLLRSASGKTGHVPVHLRARLTEIGTLELWCVAAELNQRWKLEFELRGTQKESSSSVIEAMPARFAEARGLIERFYGAHGMKGDGPKDIKQLWVALESVLGPRDSWRVPVLRELWSALHAGLSRRRRSADHERVWFQLTGHALRPGFGYPLDEWRCEQTFQAYAPRVQFHKEKPGWAAFWICWRRIAGGLSSERQQEMWADLKPYLASRLAPKSGIEKPKGIQPEGFDEMVRAAAALEQIDPAEKQLFGEWIIAYLREKEASGGPWAWSLGRLGARVPFYGSDHQVIGINTASAWLEFLLEKGLRAVDGTAFAAVQLARLTGDRSRDLPDPLRKRLLGALGEIKAPESWISMVSEVTVLSAADEAQVLGDTLPAGLQLIRQGASHK